MLSISVWVWFLLALYLLTQNGPKKKKCVSNRLHPVIKINPINFIHFASIKLPTDWFFAEAISSKYDGFSHRPILFAASIASELGRLIGAQMSHTLFVFLFGLDFSMKFFSVGHLVCVCATTVAIIINNKTKHIDGLPFYLW